jgi:hypothetical protein
MKKTRIFFLIIIASQYCKAQPADAISHVAKKYFRSNPYSVHFNTFLNHLLHDPTLLNTTTQKKTDTTFFFFKGYYNNHNPFDFKADRTEIRLAETEVDLQDSLSTTDTLLFYQLLGYSYGKEGLELVKKEFAKFDRRYGRNLYSQDSEIKNGHEIVGIAKNYFLFTSTISPVSIVWAKLDELQNVFTITLRMKVVENMATLPMPRDSR